MLKTTPAEDAGEVMVVVLDAFGGRSMVEAWHRLRSWCVNGRCCCRAGGWNGGDGVPDDSFEGGFMRVTCNGGTGCEMEGDDKDGCNFSPTY